MGIHMYLLKLGQTDFTHQRLDMGKILFYHKRRKHTQPHTRWRTTSMPAAEQPRQPADTPFAKLVVKWLKAQPGIMDAADFSRVSGFNRSVVQKWLYDGVEPKVDSLLVVYEATRQYNLTYPPDYDDPSYPFKEPGIPLPELLATQNISLPMEDVWNFVESGIREAPDLNQDEKERQLGFMRILRQRYLRGQPPFQTQQAAS